jgi:hypothetical protein
VNAPATSHDWIDSVEAELPILIKGAWQNSFSPQTDVDYTQFTTMDEYTQLYRQWSLFAGAAEETQFSETQKQEYALYQQLNLMRITSLFERYAIENFARLYRVKETPVWSEWITHLIKEECYHDVLFTRTIEATYAHHSHLKRLPEKHWHLFFRITLAMLRLIPFLRLRMLVSFIFFLFAEDITMQAYTVSRKAIARRESLIPLVWEKHAVDEARHVAFDKIMLKHIDAGVVLRSMGLAIALPICIVTSLLLNANEVWAARQLGIRVGYRALPRLMRGTTADFKKRVFKLLSQARHLV